MKRARTLLTVAGLAGISTLMFASVSADQTDTVKVPTFGQVVVYRPDKPAEVVLFISGDGGWNKGVVSMAERLRDLGALVVGIDIRTFNASMRESKRCAYPAGALEQLSRDIQLRYKLPEYIRPMLVGYSSGATLVYATLAAAPPETFTGGLSLGFCPDLDEATPMCQMRGLKTTKKSKAVGYDLSPDPGLKVPWMVLHGESDQVCSPAAARDFVSATGSSRLFSLPKVGHGFGVPANWEPQFIEAYRALVATTTRHEAPHVSIPEANDLPLVEVPASVASTRNEMAVIVSGDGGWAELDKSVAEGLANEGVPTVGLNSLRYFWTPRTPDGAASDLARVITHYSAAWHRDRVIVIGYSFGADALPFLINKLEPSLRARVAKVVLLGLGTTAEFEFHLADWLGQSGGPEYSTVPEVDRLTVPVTCVRGADEDDSACELIQNPRAHVVTVGEGHHFGGEYDRLVSVILATR
jgi:type IV secretory pathway VirJ component